MDSQKNNRDATIEPLMLTPREQSSSPTPAEPMWRSQSVPTFNKGGFRVDVEGSLSQGRGEAVTRGGAVAPASAKVRSLGDVYFADCLE